MMPDRDAGREPTQLQVLVVEDEVLIRALLCEQLRDAGLNVVEAQNADEAWAFLEAGGRADLVVSDVTMPGSMNGVELARRVRQTRPETKVIVTSGNPGPENFAQLGVFLQKPYRLDVAVTTALQSLGLRDGDA